MKDLYIAPSEIHGDGVFSDSLILKDDVIERCRVVRFYDEGNFLLRHRFALKTRGPHNYGIALGFGSIYNHSDTPNMSAYYDISLDLIVFSALIDIVPRKTELTHRYSNPRSHGV
jgi:uncharacterized protein